MKADAYAHPTTLLMAIFSSMSLATGAAAQFVRGGGLTQTLGTFSCAFVYWFQLLNGERIMRSSICVVFTMAALLSASTLALGQGGMHRGAGGVGMGRYDAAAEVTFSGTVDEVRQMPSPRSGPGGLHLIIRGDGVVQEVAVGPVSFVTSSHFNFAKGDRVIVTGAKMKMGGSDVVVAREIKKGDQVLTLRDARGVPLWSHGAMRHPS
jgi:hypothetical protein